MQRKILSMVLGMLGAAAGFSSPLMGALPSKQAPLMTKWGNEVDREKPWQEYPRPQLVRADWLCLNGVWEYQPGAAEDKAPVGTKLSSEILVPFPVESALSGVMEHHDRLWYRRTFTVPAGWSGKHVRLNFGAVDYESEVFVNGTSVGVHKGGYLPFSYDVTSNLKGDGEQEIIVRVFDPTIEGGQPRGKQTTTPEGIMYTPTTGIWQTVWLEPVSPTSISDLKITPDVDGNAVKITVNSPDAPADATVSVKIMSGDTVVKTIDGKANAELTIPIADAKLWSPDAPFLYDIEASMSQGNTAVDTVKSYFGMRKISLGEENGIKKMFLNNKFLFEIGPLDQGFWPDGIYTPPSDAAIHSEIQSLKDFGFNMVRKHIKVEPARWYYWTDKLGLLVWQDMPSPNSYMGRGQKPPKVDRVEFETELKDMVKILGSTTSIIMWDIFNEAQGQFDTKRLVGVVKELDPSRLVNEASGGNYSKAGDVHDVHSYPPPNFPEPSDTQALACGEYGGIGLTVTGHTWKPTGGGYTNVTEGTDLEELYGEFANLLKTFRDEKGMSAAVYTQVTDVETELNGLFTYDRILKCDPAEIAKANHFQYPSPTYEEVIATSEKTSQTWKYTTDKPEGDWNKPTFDDAAWQSGPGGFGTEGTPNIGKVGTEWKTDDIWLRRSVAIKGLTADQISHLVLRVYHDEGCEVFINGIRAFAVRGDKGNYEYKSISKDATAAIKPDSENLIAVHCRQTIGGQYIDVGLFQRTPGKQIDND